MATEFGSGRTEAVLWFPVQLSKNEKHCLSFWYQMRGRDVGMCSLKNVILILIKGKLETDRI